MAKVAQLPRLHVTDTDRDGGSLSESSSTTSSPKGTGFFLPLIARSESTRCKGGKGPRRASRRSEDHAKAQSSQLSDKSTRHVTGIDAGLRNILSRGRRNSVTMPYHPEASAKFADGGHRAIHAGPAPSIPNRQGVRRGSLDSCYCAARTGSPTAADQGHPAAPASHLTGSAPFAATATSKSPTIGLGQSPSFNRTPLGGLQRSRSAAAPLSRNAQQCLSPPPAASAHHGPAGFRTMSQHRGNMDAAATAAGGAASRSMQVPCCSSASAAFTFQLLQQQQLQQQQQEEQQQVLQLQQQLEFLKVLQLQQQQQEEENAKLQAELDLKLQLALQMQQQQEEQAQQQQQQQFVLQMQQQLEEQAQQQHRLELQAALAQQQQQQLVQQTQQQLEEQAQQQHMQELQTALAQLAAASSASFQEAFITGLPAMLSPQPSFDSPFVTAVSPPAASATPNSSPFPPQLVSCDSSGYVETSDSSFSSSGSFPSMDLNGGGFVCSSTGSLFSNQSLNWGQGSAGLQGLAGLSTTTAVSQGFTADNQLVLMMLS